MSVLGKFINFAGTKKTLLVLVGFTATYATNISKLKAEARIPDKLSVSSNLDKMIIFRYSFYVILEVTIYFSVVKVIPSSQPRSRPGWGWPWGT